MAGELAREVIHCSLDQEGCLRVAGTAVWTGRGAIGVDTDHLGFDIRNAVQAGDRKAGVDRRDTRSHAKCISAEISNDASLEPDDRTIAPSRKSERLQLVACMHLHE